MKELENKPQIPSDSILLHKVSAMFDELQPLVSKSPKKRVIVMLAMDDDHAFCACSGNEYAIAKSLVDFLDSSERISLLFDREVFARGIEDIDEQLVNDELETN